MWTDWLHRDHTSCARTNAESWWRSPDCSRRRAGTRGHRKDAGQLRATHCCSWPHDVVCAGARRLLGISCTAHGDAVL